MDINVEATLHVAGREVPVTVIDISAGGCKLRCPDALPIGEIVQLTIPAFRPTAATVRWSLVAGRWSLVAGRWSLVAGRWSLAGVAGLRFI